jgi:type II restriction/modification system DNA methylase subunit YeeA
MNIAQIESNLQVLFNSFNEQTFIYDFLLAYGQPKASIKRLQEGGLNLSKNDGEILWKKKIFFKGSSESDLHDLIDDLRIEDRITKHSPRFIIVTDYKNLLARDTKTNDTLDINILELPRYFDFFLPLAGMEKAQHQIENPADVKAAERMGKLYDEIKKDNPINSEEDIHNLNVFLTRLLFCFFSEDTNIFEKRQFTHSLINHTQEDGSDLHIHFERLFQVMNTPDNERGNMPAFLSSFPYVNGGLFRNSHTVPRFGRKSRQIIIDSGELDWSAINPDIFGSMIQAVITPEHRGGLGMHYTSVPNIMKVIEPLFLDDFYEEFELSKGNPKRLRQLLNRLWNAKFFDPACGSGNFLIITYKELRKLEMKIFKELNEMAFSNISLNQFYGIELDDFAHEVAILSLWLAEHQMNQVFFKEFGRSKPALPLTSAGNIVHGNATRLNWTVVCPKENRDEIYVLGNPPYLGSFLQSKEQKEDLAFVCKGFKSYKDLDYIGCWFLNASKFVEGTLSKFAFVSTNSICQGEQVALLWPFILNKGLEISFAYPSFKWTNNAKDNAAVIVSIIGVAPISTNPKKIFAGLVVHIVDKINPYLFSGKSVFITKRMKPISSIPIMSYGSKVVDDGNLIFTTEEKIELLAKYPNATPLFKKFAGSAEFIRGLERWCLYISDDLLDLAHSIPPIVKRLELVRDFRLKSTESSTREMGKIPHKFYYSVHSETNSILIPRTSSERRDYIPMGFLNGNTIVSDAASVIFNAELWIFSVLNSKIHMVWMRTVAGRLKSDYRYSSQLVYNTFPFPNISYLQKKELEKHVYMILEEREIHSERTLSQLYDPDKMPNGLRNAHHQLDLAVERCYRSKPFESDEERLEYLFKLYEQMIEEEKSKGTLFEIVSKPKKKKK